MSLLDRSAKEADHLYKLVIVEATVEPKSAAECESAVNFVLNAPGYGMYLGGWC